MVRLDPVRPDYIHQVFAGQCEITLGNLARIASRVGDFVDVVNVCGTDFGTQSSSFCSVDTFRELWMPYYRRINEWIHGNTRWKTFKHSCGAVEKFIDSFIECGFDILNPVQCSAAGMVDFAEKNGVMKDDKGVRTSSDIIRLQLKALIARQIWKNDGFYPVIHEQDRALAKALQLMESNRVASR